MSWLLSGVLVALALYVAGVLALVVAGRRSDAAALARFVPDCVVLMRRLAVVLRCLIRAAGAGVLREHWPGPAGSVGIVLRLAQSPGGWRTT